MTANRSMIGARFVTQWIGILLAGWLALGTTSAEAVVHYLTVDGAGNADGSSWVNAASNIQAALALADIDEIRMAGGVYDLTVALFWTAGTNVTVRGGYDAATGNHDPTNQVTILRQTGPEQRVMLMEDLEDCRLESVTLTGGTVGTPDADGAGMRILNSDIEIIDCVISNNVTSVYRQNRNGGGIHVVGGSVEFLRCRIEHNRIDLNSHIQTFTGGGIYVTGGSTVIRHSRIAGNVLRVTDTYGLSTARGAGLYVAGGGSLRVENSSIVSNICGRTDRSMTGFAAGAGHAAGSALTLRNCLIYGNANLSDNGNLSRAGAGVILENGGLIENCTISGNRMDHETEIGVGLVVNGGTVSNTIVYANWRGLQQQDFGGNTENVFYSCAPELIDGANNNITASPRFINAAAGDFRLDFGSACIDTGNNAAWMTTATDLDGNARIRQGRPDRSLTVDRGAYESAPLPADGPLVCDFTTVPVVGMDEIDVVFTAYAGGANTDGLHYFWDFTASGEFDLAGTDKRTVTNTYGPGTHSVRLAVSNQNDETHQIIKTDYVRVMPSIVYIATNGDNSTGADWAGAFRNMQTALDQPGVSEIRIAGGEYLLTDFLNWQHHADVTVRGGYEGTGDPGNHDPEQWPTILRQSVSRQRVILMNALTNCRLEQVTITGGTVGSPDADGAGMRILNSDIAIIDCVISNNVTSVYRQNRNGGGINVVGGSVEFLRCRIENNRIDLNSHINTFTGGGIYVTGGSTVIRESRIAGNVLRVTDTYGLSTARGAGLYLAGGGSLRVENSSIVSNICGRTDRSMTGFAAGAGHAAGSALTLRNCLIAHNANLSQNQDLSRAGAGVILENSGLIENCTIAGNQMYNSTDTGAGLRFNGGTVSNTIVYANWRGLQQQDFGGNPEAVFYSCAPELIDGVNHNVTVSPRFIDAAAGDFRLDFGSPCIDTGNNADWMTTATDLDGNARIRQGRPDRSVAVDRGAYESAPLPADGPLVCDFTADPVVGLDQIDVLFTAYSGGANTNGLHYYWDFDSSGDFDLAGADKRTVTNTYGPGTHSVRLVVSNQNDETHQIIKTDYIYVSSSIAYVSTTGGNSSGADWDGAFTNPQTAMDQPGITEIRIAGGEYLLTDVLNLSDHDGVTIRGGYEGTGNPGDHDPAQWPTILRQTASGQRVILMNELTNCRLEQVTITGGTVGTPDADGAGMRILNSDIAIIDCVISNNVTSVYRQNRNGGGIHVAGGSVQFLRCRIEHNRIDLDSHIQTFTGGGIYVTGGSTVIRESRIAGNILRVTDTYGLSTARGAGLYLAGGGSLWVENSSIVSNICGRTDRTMTAFAAGSGHAAGSALTLRNCLIAHNANLSQNPDLSRTGAGVVLESGGLIENCTIAGNSMDNVSDIGAGLRINGGTVSNTIVYANLRAGQRQDFGGNTENVFYSCAPELIDGVNNNITTSPRFIDAAVGDFRLDFGSPCIDTGNNAGWMTTAYDLAGNARIIQGRPDRSPTVDCGAYEMAPIPQEGPLVAEFAADPVNGIDQIEVQFAAYADGANTNGLIYHWDFYNCGAFDISGAEYRTVSHGYGPGIHSVRLKVVNEASQSDEVVKEAYITVTPSIAYVSLAGDNSTGADWSGAFSHLQVALDLPQVNEIRIAGGEYLLTDYLNWSEHTGVTIRGGYQGIGDPGNHDPEQWPTILRQTTSGQRVMLMSDLDDCRQEHVTLTGGMIVDRNIADGAGLRVLGSDITIADCVFSNNTTYINRQNRNGGGVYIDGGPVTLLRCRVVNNTVHIHNVYGNTASGGGIYVHNGPVDIRQNVIAVNTVQMSGYYGSIARGGGMFAAGNATVLLDGSRIIGNVCRSDDGLTSPTRSAGIGHASGTPLVLRNCLISANTNLAFYSNDSHAGAGVTLETGGLIENCTIGANRMYHDAEEGAGLLINGGSVTNTIIYANWRDEMHQNIGFGDSANESANIFYSCAPELTAALNHNINDDPLFIDADGGDFRLQSRYGQYAPSGDLIYHAQTSPAMDAGINQSWMIDAVDLQGFPRIVRGVPRGPGPAKVDMGAYEVNAPLPGTLFLFR